MENDDTRKRIREEMRIRREEKGREILQGCLVALVTATGIAAFVMWNFGGDDPVEDPRAVEQQAKKDAALKAQTDATFDRIASSASRPCEDHGLYFFKVLGTWYLTCGDGCAGVPASSLYPTAVLRILDEYAVRSRMTLLGLRRFAGQC